MNVYVYLSKQEATCTYEGKWRQERNISIENCTIFVFIHILFSEISGDFEQPTNNGPPQPRGVFSCRIANCTEKLPVCRMLNHVRTFHMANLTEVSGTDTWI